MLGRPSEPSHRHLPLGFQNWNLPDETSNSPVAVAGLFSCDLFQHFVRETLHEPRSKQRGRDKTVTNILGVRQRLFLCGRPTEGLCRNQRAAGRWYEFALGPEMAGAKFRYRTTTARQVLSAPGCVAAGAGA